MNPVLRRELSATIGAPWPGFYLLIFYVYGLGSALLVGSAVHNPGVLDLATMLWVTGDLAVVIGAAASLDRFEKSARELRLPSHASTMRRMYALLCTFLVVVPTVLFGTLISDGRQLIWTTLIMPLCLLWPRLARYVRPHGPSRSGVSTNNWVHPIRAPSDAIRVYLGNAYAPVPLASRVFKLRLVAAVLWTAPLIFAETDIMRPVRGFAPYYLGATGGLVWAWLTTSLARFIAGRSAAFAELALLPGLGNPASQRRAFYAAALARPMYACTFFAALALMWAWSMSHDFRSIALLAFVLSFLMLLSAQNIVGQLLAKQTVRSTTLQVYLLSIQFYIAFVLLSRASDFAEKFTYIFLSSLVLLAAILLVITWRHVRRLAQLPHPFVQ